MNRGLVFAKLPKRVRYEAAGGYGVVPTPGRIVAFATATPKIALVPNTYSWYV